MAVITASEQADAIIKQSYILRSDRGEDEAEAFLRANMDTLLAGADAGNIAAMIELAELAMLSAQPETVGAWIARAEASVRAGHAIDHLHLHDAYFRLRRGWGDAAGNERRAIHHLEQAAGLGETGAQTALALHHHHGGTAGCPRDEAAYLHWLGKAVAGGDPFAIHLLAEHQFRAGQTIEPHLLAALRVLAPDHRPARKLLRAQAMRDRMAARAQ
jgi:TPR repeat protein